MKRMPKGVVHMFQTLLQILVAILSAVATARVMRKKGRSATGGYFLGGLLPILGLIIALSLKPKNIGIEPSKNEGLVHAYAMQESGEKSILGVAQEQNREIPMNVPRQQSNFNTALEIPGDSYFSQEVSGESHHLTEIRQLTQRLGGEGEHLVRAMLVPEPTNKYDANAIKVMVDKIHCGYIPKEDTSKLRPLLELAAARKSFLTANARLWSGKSAWDDEWVASISLSIPWDISTVFPVNDLPTGAVLCPRGGMLQVSEEAAHLKSINKVISESYVEGNCGAYVTLVASLNDKGKDTVRVMNQDEELGMLSPASAKKFAPVIRQISTNSPFAAFATFKGNAVAAEITLDVRAPEKLSQADLSSLGL
jgi:hypothetical protein